MSESEFTGTYLKFWSTIIKRDDLPPCWRDRANQLAIKVYPNKIPEAKWFIPFNNSPPHYCMLWYRDQKEKE